jgi:translation initiation factor IF-3
MDTRDAFKIAQQRGLDLVEIAPTAKPPVCRIMDYGKYKYEQHKKKKEARKHQSHTKLKEIKFHANVGEHDYQTKVRHAHEFLAQGHRIKFSLYFRGRENAHHELGFEVMNRCAEDCSDIGQIEQPPRLVGRNLTMLIYPKTQKT